MAGHLAGKLLSPNAGLLSRMAVGGFTGGVVSGGTHVALNAMSGRPWNEGLGQAVAVGVATGLVDAFTDYYGDKLVDGYIAGRRRPTGGGVEGEGLRRLGTGEETEWREYGLDREWAPKGLRPIGDADTLRPRVDGAEGEAPRSPVRWDPRAKQWRDPETGRLISLEDAQVQGRRPVVEEQPGRVVGVDEAERLSGIPKESLLGAQAVAQEKGVDAAFRDVNPRLGKVAAHTVPKPPGEYASPLWKTNDWGYVQNKETGEILVKVSDNEYAAFDAPQVYDQETGRIYPELEGRVVGPDIDPYWWHGAEGRIAQETEIDYALQAAFGEAMGERITHGQWMEYPGARGPNGPALVITRQGEFVWLEQREIAAWFAYHKVPYPSHFSK